MNKVVKTILACVIIYSIYFICLVIFKIGEISARRSLQNCKNEEPKPYKQIGPEYLTEEENKKHWAYIYPERPLSAITCKFEAKHCRDLYKELLAINKTHIPRYHQKILEDKNYNLKTINNQIKEKLEICGKISELENQIRYEFQALEAKIAETKNKITELEKAKSAGQKIAQNNYELETKIKNLREQLWSKIRINKRN